MKRQQLRVAIIGGGPVGAMQACLFGNKSILVDVYETRSDMRKAEHVPGRSINLALSERGRAALREIGLEENIIGRNSIPMRARLIHNIDGTRHPIPYGRDGQSIYSTGRRLLNEELLTAAEGHPEVTIHFDHKLIACDLDKGTMNFKCSKSDKVVTTSADLIVGCDGAFSTVRRHILKKPRFNYSQTYIPHGYMEFTIPATTAGDFAMERNYLHIWPRGELMLIALPNPSRDFTATLFMPFVVFDSLATPDDLLNFFQQQFPDAIRLIGETKLVNDFFKMEASPVVSIKCSPYHLGNKAVILGDAAHAMVPFYGQGLNAGLEDCLIFMDILTRHRNHLEKALMEYSQYRNPDAEAICDLAMYNYIEMRHLVNTVSFRLRKRLDTVLHALFPKSWIPLYTMVTFNRTRYHQCIEQKQWQDKVLRRAVMMLCAVTSIVPVLLFWK